MLKPDWSIHASIDRIKSEAWMFKLDKGPGWYVSQGKFAALLARRPGLWELRVWENGDPRTLLKELTALPERFPYGKEQADSL